MPLGPILADGASQVPYRISGILFPVLVGIISGLCTIVCGWFLLRKSELYRRQSSWNPIADLLWKERFSIYGRLLSAAYGVRDAMQTNSLEKLRQAAPDFVESQRRLVVFGSESVVTFSEPLLVAIEKIISQADVSGIESVSRSQIETYVAALLKLERALRQDLHVDTFDARLAGRT